MGTFMPLRNSAKILQSLGCLLYSPFFKWWCYHNYFHVRENEQQMKRVREEWPQARESPRLSLPCSYLVQRLLQHRDGHLPHPAATSSYAPMCHLSWQQHNWVVSCPQLDKCKNVPYYSFPDSTSLSKVIFQTCLHTYLQEITWFNWSVQDYPLLVQYNAFYQPWIAHIMRSLRRIGQLPVGPRSLDYLLLLVC